MGRCKHWPCLGARGVRAELGAVSSVGREREEGKAFQVVCGGLGGEAGFVGSHMGYQTAIILQVGDHI